MNKTSWIFVGATAVICLIMGFFLTKPNAVGAWRNFKDIQKAKSDLADVSKKKEVLTKLSENNQLSSLYDIALKYIPEDGSSSALVIGLSAMAGENNLKVDQLSFTAAAKKTETATTDSTDATKTDTTKTDATTTDSAKITELKFSINLSGTFTDFLNFLKSAESSSRLITFTNLNFSQATDSFTAQLTGKAYWKQGTALESSLSNIEISQSTIDMFRNLKSYGTPINLPTESGFGRTNPFDAVQ